MNIAVVRLGAMGDVIHALPAVAALKAIPGACITWIIDPRWRPLVEGNPSVDQIVTLDRRVWSSVRECWSLLRRTSFDLAVDLQGLIKSAIAAQATGAGRIFGFDRAEAREKAATLLYTEKVRTHAVHVVDKNRKLAESAGAPEIPASFWMPPGAQEGALPSRPFVVACPLAGWRSKQWPAEFYAEIVPVLDHAGYALVVNGPESARVELESIAGAHLHFSGIAGLIDVTRRAAAVIGVDSGPLHVAAALGKPGVAIFGPTDPDRNGPYGGSMTVLRDSSAATTYAREDEIAPSMRAIRPEAVAKALLARIREGVAQ